MLTGYNLWVVTGPVLEQCIDSIGSKNICVAKQFYKIALRKDLTASAAFLVPHKRSDKDPEFFQTSIDNIQQLTGIDFFPDLTEKHEALLEQ